MMMKTMRVIIIVTTTITTITVTIIAIIIIGQAQWFSAFYQIKPTCRKTLHTSDTRLKINFVAVQILMTMSVSNRVKYEQEYARFWMLSLNH